MNHADAIRERYEALERQIGITRASSEMQSNAKMLGAVKFNGKRIEIIPNRPVEKIKALGVVNINDIKDKGIAWATNRVAETLNVPKRMIKAECIVCSLEFLTKVEPNKELARKIADDKRYIAWFENRYRVALIYTYRAMSTLPVKGTLIEFYDACTKQYMNQGRFVREYLLFKDENLGGQVNEPVL